MTAQYRCDKLRRLEVVRGQSSPNAIDYLEVVDVAAAPASLRQHTLLVRCVHAVAGLSAANVRIDGGVRRTPVNVIWAHPADAIPATLLEPGELPDYTLLADADHVLVVRTDSRGDFSTYTLRIVKSPTDPAPHTSFDTQLAAVDFSFKVECPSDFDCRPASVCPPLSLEEPALDYLAKDYGSFRRLLLDRLSVLIPDWRERNPAEQMMALVELLAYVGDHLSYFQDAVATEAYLGTALRRISVRRHARLLDYHMHDGCNARAWVQCDVDAAADGFTIDAGTPLIAGYSAPPGGIDLGPEELVAAVDDGAVVFETMHPISVYVDHNELRFYTWGETECCLPRGATRATLRGAHPNLEEGDVLLFEEVKSPTTGVPGDADAARRQAVRLTSVTPVVDPVGGQFEVPLSPGPLEVTEIEWHAEDRLAFPVCISARAGEEHGGQLLEDVSVARGNVVLVDHGLSVVDSVAVPVEGVLHWTLQHGPVTQQGQTVRGGRALLFDPDRAALAAMQWSTARALPAIWLTDGAPEPWQPQRDLLGSDRFARDFVVEVSDDGVASLRFGDGVTHGRRPAGGTSLEAHYRVGNGRSGNVGAATIRHLVTSSAGIAAVRNPFPARGGIDPESMTQVRQFAPQAFRVQERAVTAADYAEVLERRADVQRAVAAFRWTGSWHTAFVTADRIGGDSADPAFRAGVRDYLERFRMAGVDLDVRRPAFVPLHVEVTVCVRPGYFAANVELRLREAFGRFFDPDAFTFGQPVYLSRLYEVAMSVDGVAHADITTFQRWGALPAQELANGVLPVGKHEIARLDNDPNFPENGKLVLTMAGGL